MSTKYKYDTGSSNGLNSETTIDKPSGDNTDANVPIVDPNGKKDPVPKSIAPAGSETPWDETDDTDKVAEWESEHDVSLDSHFMDQWDDRADVDSCAPETAWANGVNITFATDFWENEQESTATMRVHPESEMIMLKRYGKLRTCFQTDSVEFTPIRCYIYEVINQERYGNSIESQSGHYKYMKYRN